MQVKSLAPKGVGKVLGAVLGEAKKVANRRGFVTALDRVPPMFADGTSDPHRLLPASTWSTAR